MRRTGRAVVNPYALDASAICDRCGMRYNHSSLSWQYQWGGEQLINLKLLVCSICLDVPQEQFRTIVLPADPAPISDPRPENFVAIESSLRRTQEGQYRQTENDNLRSVQQTGTINKLDNEPGITGFPESEKPTLPYQNTQIPNTGTPPNPGGSDS